MAGLPTTITLRLATIADAEQIREIYNYEVQHTTKLLATAARSGFHTVFARINAASVALHRACGYESVGIEREVGRKFGRWHDVALMQRLL